MNKKEKDLFDEMVEMLKCVRDSNTTEYGKGDDDPGACIHCYRVSYKDHSDDCLITKVENLLKKLEQ